MAKTHSTLSRRAFMKALGLGAAGVAATAAAAPVFSDLDELMASESATWKRPWWVKKRDIGKPTIEIEWDVWGKPYDLYGFLNWDDKPGYSYDEFNNTVKGFVQKKWPDWKGYTVRDEALYDGFMAARGYLMAGLYQGRIPWRKAKRPEERGYTKWQGTQDEALQMVRAAMTIFGMGPTGVVELDPSTTRNFVWGRDAGGTRIVWQDGITEGYIKDGVQYIPSSHRWAIVSYNPEPNEMLSRTPHKLASGTASLSYTRVSITKGMMEGFLYALGYNCVYNHDYQTHAPFGIFGGIGENARMGQTIVSPDFPYGRTHCIIFTDLPLTPTNPIDAGIPKFCETCGICAEQCPVGAIMEKGQGMSYEMNTERREWGEKWNDNLPGFLGWRCDTWKCDGPCQSCKGSCPFNSVANGSFLHNFVKGTVSTTSLFNGMFASMEDIVRYGKEDKDPDSWWTDDKARWTYGTHGNALFVGGN